VLLSVLTDALLRKIQEMAPADRKNLNTTVLGKLVDLGIESLEIGRARIYTLKCLTKDINVVYKINALCPVARMLVFKISRQISK
jgi:hypothetical protein